jgi:hypothetical protein
MTVPLITAPAGIGVIMQQFTRGIYNNAVLHPVPWQRRQIGRAWVRIWLCNDRVFPRPSSPFGDFTEGTCRMPTCDVFSKVKSAIRRPPGTSPEMSRDLPRVPPGDAGGDPGDAVARSRRSPGSRSHAGIPGGQRDNPYRALQRGMYAVRIVLYIL